MQLPKSLQLTNDLAEVKAIRAVWGDNCHIQYCIWHVQRAWMNQLVDKVVEWRTARNKLERRYLEMQEMRDQMKVLVWELYRNEFFSKWDTFKITWSVRQSAFVNYFEKQWMPEEKYRICARCYHTAVYTNMLTNNYVESWHKQLKAVYLKRQYPRRVDFLIYTLVEELEPDMVSMIK